MKDKVFVPIDDEADDAEYQKKVQQAIADMNRPVSSNKPEEMDDE